MKKQGSTVETVLAGLAGSALSRALSPSLRKQEAELLDTVKSVPARLRRLKAVKHLIAQGHEGVPHATLAKVLGEPEPSLAKIHWPKLLLSPVAESALGAAGAVAYGPAGALGGSLLGGLVRPHIQRMYERHLNRKLLSKGPSPAEIVQTLAAMPPPPGLKTAEYTAKHVVQPRVDDPGERALNDPLWSPSLLPRLLNPGAIMLPGIATGALVGMSPETIKRIQDAHAADPALKSVQMHLGRTGIRALAQHVMGNTNHNVLSRAGRFALGVPSSLMGALLGADHYNPLTHSIHIFADNPAVGLHELGHAKDFKGDLTRMALRSNVLPLIASHMNPALAGVIGLGQNLRNEAAASGYASARLKPGETGASLAPAYGSYAGSLLGTLSSMHGGGLGHLMAGPIAGMAAGGALGGLYNRLKGHTTNGQFAGAMTRSGIGALIANTIMEHFKHADASTTPEATLTKTALSPLFLPLALGRLGGAMSTFAQNRANIPKMDQARRLVQSVDPQTRSTLLRSTIQQHFGDLPHATYAQILGKPAVGLLARTVPHMIHAPALALAGGAMGAMAGPLGLAAGSMAGGFLSRKLQNMYERHLNRKLGSVQPPPKEEVQEACSSLGLSNWAQSKKPEVTESQAETLAQRHGGPEADANDWQDGLKVELEHGIAAGDANVTNNHPDMTAKIVKSHMDEDKKYYDKLEQVEKKACRLNAYQTSLAGLSRKMKVSR